MKLFKRKLIGLSVILSLGLISAFICQLFVRDPADRYIHIRNFRYGKDPAVIRCNRGDRLHLTFSTDDTGHSFFLEEFDIDAKVSPASDEVTVFKPSDPTINPISTKELTFTAQHPGILNLLVAKSNFRCHVWCGPLHAFEQGKLIIMPNTLLFFSMGSMLGIILLWLYKILKKSDSDNDYEDESSYTTDLFEKNKLLRRIVVSRWPQLIFTLLAMVMIYIVIMTSVFGTKVSGRNLGVLLMWAVWLFLLIAIMTPFGGRIWCTICPLPFFGDFFQRRSFFFPIKGKTGEYNNKFFGLSKRWPGWLKNSWLRLIVFLILATFSTTLVASPKISGITVLFLLLVPTLMALIWELRAFCRYVCPVSVFVGPFAGMSFIALRNKSQAVCDQCKPHFCEKGSSNGWACPYGINVGEMKENIDCGLCLECTRSCLYQNISIYKRPFASERKTRNMSEAWMAVAVFTIAIIYSVLYLGPWPVVRDYVNILDKSNWNLFSIYSIMVWSLVLFIVPGLLYFLSWSATRLSKIKLSTKQCFLEYTGSLIPLALMLWIAFVIPMLFVNTTFIAQSVSDPFGWGWDFFGTANIPWHQFLPQYVPWLQSISILIGLYLSLRNIRKTWVSYNMNGLQMFLVCLPMCLFIVSVSVTMLLFFTN
jgi:polyferredoxin